MRLSPVLFTAMTAVALAACERSADTPAPVAASEGMDAAAAESHRAPPEFGEARGNAEAATGTLAGPSFDCEGGHRVQLVGEDTARVTLADGRVIELPRRTDGVAEYRGEALIFDIDADGRGGVLGQDEVGGFACEPGD